MTLKEVGNVSWDNTPILVENGVTKRLLVGVWLSAWWNKTLEWDVVLERIPEPIIIPINFVLGDNTVRKFTFEVDNFFYDIHDFVEAKSITDFDFCP